MVLQATCAAAWTLHSPWSLRSHYSGASYLGARLSDHRSGAPSSAASHVAAFSQAFRQHSPAAKAAFEERGCLAGDLFSRWVALHDCVCVQSFLFSASMRSMLLSRHVTTSAIIFAIGCQGAAASLWLRVCEVAQHPYQTNQ